MLNDVLLLLESSAAAFVSDRLPAVLIVGPLSLGTGEHCLVDLIRLENAWQRRIGKLPGCGLCGGLLVGHHATGHRTVLPKGLSHVTFFG